MRNTDNYGLSECGYNEPHSVFFISFLLHRFSRYTHLNVLFYAMRCEIELDDF